MISGLSLTNLYPVEVGIIKRLSSLTVLATTVALFLVNITFKESDNSLSFKVFFLKLILRNEVSVEFFFIVYTIIIFEIRQIFNNLFTLSTLTELKNESK